MVGWGGGGEVSKVKEKGGGFKCRVDGDREREGSLSLPHKTGGWILATHPAQPASHEDGDVHQYSRVRGITAEAEAKVNTNNK